MCLAKPKRAFYYAFICTLASVLGALLGYAIGFFLFDTVGKAILNAYGLLHQFDEFAGRFNEQGWIIVMLAGFTPLPFKRSEEHTSELQSLMRISYAVFCLKKKKNTRKNQNTTHN